jgi:hypothetical protein
MWDQFTDFDVWKRVITRGFQLDGGPPRPVATVQPVSVQVDTPDYTMPLLVLGGLGILMLAGPLGKRRK